MYRWTDCFCQVPYPVVTFSAQLDCLLLSGPLLSVLWSLSVHSWTAFVRSLTLWSLSCTDGLTAFVRSLTLWSLSVHSWTAFARSLTLWSLSCTAGLTAFVRSLTLWSLSCTAGLSAFVRSLTLWSLLVHSWAVCFCQVPYPVVTISAQLDCLLLSGPLPCGHYQCTAGLSAFVRSLTLLSLSVHSWTVCFCQVPYPVVTISAQLDCLLLSGHSPCCHFQCTAESGKPCDDCQCFPHTLTMWSLSLHSWSIKRAPNLHTLRILSELLHWQLIWALSRPQ